MFPNFLAIGIKRLTEPALVICKVILIMTVEKPQKRNIPSAKHPWRSTTFFKHVPYEIPDSEMFAYLQ